MRPQGLNGEFLPVWSSHYMLPGLLGQSPSSLDTDRDDVRFQRNHGSCTESPPRVPRAYIGPTFAALGGHSPMTTKLSAAGYL